MPVATKENAFEDQVALVTGGGTGLGFEVSRQLLARGARAVVVASRDPKHHERIAAEARHHKGVVDSVVLDVREPDRVSEAFAAAAARHGRLDLLVANAAGNFLVPSLRLKAKGWRAVVDIVLNGTFYCCQAAARIFARQADGGSIVTIGATYAWTGMPGVAHSAAAKAGVLALTRSLAVEWADLKIRVNCVAPGVFHSDGAAANLWPSAEQETALRQAVPLKRFARVEEVAEAVLFLAARSSAYITGECLVVDGGAWLGRGLGR